MKNDIVLYERIYQHIKGQIECGLLPGGAKLPSRAALCEEFQVSEKTVRRVLDLLQKNQSIITEQRKRPVVSASIASKDSGKSNCVPADMVAVKDIFATGRLICYPVIEHGIAQCTGEDWTIPTDIAAQMDPSRSTEFWVLFHRFWRFFMARNGNDLILRAVDSLGFADQSPGSFELRRRYLISIRKFLDDVRNGCPLDSSIFGELGDFYGISENEALSGKLHRVAPDSPLCIGPKGLKQRICSVEERYSRVYMDLVGLIAIGRYRPGDRLPSYLELQKIYSVSSDTVNKAIGILQNWGVVTAKRGSGIYVSMDLTALKKIQIPAKMIACHLRRFLDSLELLSLTIDGVAAHAGTFTSPSDAKHLKDHLNRLWNEEYLYQLTPIVLLEFITDHIQYTALKELYQVVTDHYHIGRSIPKLVTQAKTSANLKIHQQSLDAVECLTRGDSKGFSRKACEMFLYVHRLILDECKRLGYLEIAGNVYDGTVLWKERKLFFDGIDQNGEFV